MLSLQTKQWRICPCIRALQRAVVRRCCRPDSGAALAVCFLYYRLATDCNTSLCRPGNGGALAIYFLSYRLATDCNTSLCSLDGCKALAVDFLSYRLRYVIVQTGRQRSCCCLFAVLQACNRLQYAIFADWTAVQHLKAVKQNCSGLRL